MTSFIQSPTLRIHVRHQTMNRSKGVWLPWFKALGTVGHVARAVVFGLVAVFLLKASYDHKANEAIGLDGALAKLHNGAYGSWLLGAIALGLIAFSCFSLVEARYRRI